MKKFRQFMENEEKDYKFFVRYFDEHGRVWYYFSTCLDNVYNDSNKHKNMRGQEIKKISELNKFLDRDIGLRNFICIEPKFQPWFIKNRIKYINHVSNLNKDLKDKNSHLIMGGKFGVFDDED